MRISKSKAFLLGLGAIIGVYAAALALGRDTAINNVLDAIVLLTSLYIGGNVLDNGVKGKFYRPELDNKKEP